MPFASVDQRDNSILGRLTCVRARQLMAMRRPYDDLVDYWYSPDACACEECEAVANALPSVDDSPEVQAAKEVLVARYRPAE
jgi:hypothetical protein